ncbi:uncharacterized protein TNCV_3049971 [Trichonephila clavipes]|nr:uncharacterized protein TNCV_3049971 [Trichonephila clavipes]
MVRDVAARSITATYTIRLSSQVVVQRSGWGRSVVSSCIYDKSASQLLCFVQHVDRCLCRIILNPYRLQFFLGGIQKLAQDSIFSTELRFSKLGDHDFNRHYYVPRITLTQFEPYDVGGCPAGRSISTRINTYRLVDICPSCLQLATALKIVRTHSSHEAQSFVLLELRLRSSASCGHGCEIKALTVDSWVGIGCVCKDVEFVEFWRVSFSSLYRGPSSIPCVVPKYGLRSPSGRVGGSLNSRRVASPLVRLVAGEERWEALDHPQGVLPQNWGETELNRSVMCIGLKATSNDRRHLALSHAEFHGP